MATSSSSGGLFGTLGSFQDVFTGAVKWFRRNRGDARLEKWSGMSLAGKLIFHTGDVMDVPTIP
jgi:hypothetical protein